MLVGRVTYEAAEEMDLSHAERTYAFSRTMTGSVPENVTITEPVNASETLLGIN